MGPDPGAGGKKNRTKRTAAIGVQKNTHLSRDGLQLLIPEPRLGPQEHVDAAHKLLHPFAHSPELPLDLKFAAELLSCYPEETVELRARKLKRLQSLAKDCEELDQRARDRMSAEVKVASSTIKLGFLSALIHLVRWPDWQLPAFSQEDSRWQGTSSRRTCILGSRRRRSSQNIRFLIQQTQINGMKA